MDWPIFFNQIKVYSLVLGIISFILYFLTSGLLSAVFIPFTCAMGGVFTITFIAHLIYDTWHWRK